MIAGRAPLVLALVVLAACGRDEGGCATPRAATPLDHATAGTITGTVTFEGSPPSMQPLPLGGEPACAAQHAGPVLAGDALVHEGRVENVLVYIKDGLGDRVFPVPDDAVIIDQVGCLYRPHVTAAQACQPIEFRNSDAVLHNVHGTPEHSSAWNFSMARAGTQRAVRVAKPEVMIEVRCDVHPWMRAYLGVLDHPYFAVTGPEGRFRLPDVPPGDYVVASWHERFGVREARVTVGPRETKDVALAYAAAAQPRGGN